MKQCQNCGWSAKIKGRPSECGRCGAVFNKFVQAGTRADKRFELVKAIVGGTFADTGVYEVKPKWAVNQADAILTEMYGPEQGGE